MKALLCFSLFALGYLLGTVGNPLHAQGDYFYGSNGTSGSVHTLIPGGSSTYYDSNGNSGLYVPGQVAPPVSNYGRNPC